SNTLSSNRGSRRCSDLSHNGSFQTSLLFFFFFNDTAPTEIYTFPTRRSSDLYGGISGPRIWEAAQGWRAPTARRIQRPGTTARARAFSESTPDRRWRLGLRWYLARLRPCGVPERSR